MAPKDISSVERETYRNLWDPTCVVQHNDSEIMDRWIEVAGFQEFRSVSRLMKIVAPEAMVCKRLEAMQGTDE